MWAVCGGRPMAGGLYLSQEISIDFLNASMECTQSGRLCGNGRVVHQPQVPSLASTYSARLWRRCKSVVNPAFGCAATLCTLLCTPITLDEKQKGIVVATRCVPPIVANEINNLR